MKKVNTGKSSNIRKQLTDTSALILPFLIYAIPAMISYMLVINTNGILHFTSLFLSPFIFSFFFVATAGIITLPFQDGIKPGRFQRNTGTSVYSKRRIYGTCWTTVYYCKPVYFLLINTRFLKQFTFRLFGYKGNLDFTVYPDCWIRDLAVLDIHKNAYLANRCTIGSNICHKDGTISVGKITIGENSIVGHLAMVAHGVTVGMDTELGADCGIGISVTIGNEVNVGPMTLVNHYATIGNNVIIGARSLIGCGARIAANIKIPAGALIPDKAIILTQDDVNKYISSTYLFNENAKEENELAMCG